MFDMSWFLELIKNGQNPEQIMLSILETRMKGTPIGDNLISLARSKNTKGIEKFARNLYGDNFDKEFEAFRKKYGL